MTRLTDAKVKGLKPKGKRYVQWDDGCPGLGVRISTSGKRSFVFMFRFDSKARMMTLGEYPRLSLSDARIKASQAREKVQKDIDPGLEFLAGKKADREAYTIKDLVNEYLLKHAKVKKKSWREDERILYKDVVSVWGRKKARAVHRRDIVVLLDEIKERAELKGGSGIQANRTLAVIRKMFNFAVSRSILEGSPCVSIESPAKENRRDRVLSEAEIKKFWKGLDKARMALGTKLSLKLQLVTMQRKGEIVQIEIDDLDLESRWWTQPGIKTKNEYSHRVWLTSLAVDIIQEAKAIAGDSKWLFPSARGDGHLTFQAVDQALRKNQFDHPKKKTQDVFKIPHFTPHDLRRTAASRTTGSGVSRFVIKRVLNHADTDVTGIYDLHSYDGEKKYAHEAWDRRLQAILSGKSGRIIEMKRK